MTVKGSGWATGAVALTAQTIQKNGTAQVPSSAQYRSGKGGHHLSGTSPPDFDAPAENCRTGSASCQRLELPGMRCEAHERLLTAIDVHAPNSSQVRVASPDQNWSSTPLAGRRRRLMLSTM